jgi:hypothetical protein
LPHDVEGQVSQVRGGGVPALGGVAAGHVAGVPGAACYGQGSETLWVCAHVEEEVAGIAGVPA